MVRAAIAKVARPAGGKAGSALDTNDWLIVVTGRHWFTIILIAEPRSLGGRYAGVKVGRREKPPASPMSLPFAQSGNAEQLSKGQFA